jgi:hypothetical protein
MLEAILELPGVDVNKPDNEGNTPLHFAAQAGKSFQLFVGYFRPDLLLMRCRQLR